MFLLNKGHLSFIILSKHKRHVIVMFNKLKLLLVFCLSPLTNSVLPIVTELGHMEVIVWPKLNINYIYGYYNILCLWNALLANSVLNELSVKLIYKIVFLKNKRLRPLVKIIINVSNFLTRYRTIVFFKEEKNLSGLLIEKNFRSAKPHVPSRFLKQFRSFCERRR